MKEPGPDHPIIVSPAPRRVRVKYQGHVIADTADALVLKEADYPPVFYFPRSDVAMEYMSRSERATHCPYKGDASYYTLLMDGDFAENAVWTYETPYPAMQSIAGRLAFYPDNVEIYEVDDDQAVVHPERGDVDEIVQHTDSGSGASQKPAWAPTVETPRDA